MVTIAFITHKIGYPLMFLLPLFILFFLITGFIGTEKWYENIRFYIAGVFWFLLLLDSIFITSSGYTLAVDFNQEVNRLYASGFPIKSVEGFEILQNKIQNIFTSSFLILVAIFISFIAYSMLLLPKIIDDLLKTPSFENIDYPFHILVTIIGIGLILIAIGIALVLRLPEKPVLTPGALMNYYLPTNFPLQLDNFLSDAIYAFLDPVTKMQWDEWTQYISENLNSKFDPEEDPVTRVETAREKILLLAYVFLTMPETITDKILQSELNEIFKDQRALEGFFQGKNSTISWNIIIHIIKIVKRTGPEIFQVVDRLIVDLTNNLEKFEQQDLWVTITAPSTVIGNIGPFRMVVFILNRDSKKWGSKKRPVTIKNANEALPLPDEYTIYLDEAEEMEITTAELP